MFEEARKETVAGTEEQEFSTRGFDPFNFILHQLNRIDARLEARFDKLDNKIDTQIALLREEMQVGDASLREEIRAGDAELHKEIHNNTRTLIALVVTVVVGFVTVILQMKGVF